MIKVAVYSILINICVAATAFEVGSNRGYEVAKRECIADVILMHAHFKNAKKCPKLPHKAPPLKHKPCKEKECHL
jgi:hypothetical protein